MPLSPSCQQQGHAPIASDNPRRATKDDTVLSDARLTPVKIIGEVLNSYPGAESLLAAADFSQVLAAGSADRDAKFRVTRIARHTHEELRHRLEGRRRGRPVQFAAGVLFLAVLGAVLLSLDLVELDGLLPAAEPMLLTLGVTAVWVTIAWNLPACCWPGDIGTRTRAEYERVVRLYEADVRSLPWLPTCWRAVSPCLPVEQRSAIRTRRAFRLLSRFCGNILRSTDTLAQPLLRSGLDKAVSWLLNRFLSSLVRDWQRSPKGAGWYGEPCLWGRRSHRSGAAVRTQR